MSVRFTVVLLHLPECGRQPNDSDFWRAGHPWARGLRADQKAMLHCGRRVDAKGIEVTVSDGNGDGGTRSGERRRR